MTSSASICVLGMCVTWNSNFIAVTWTHTHTHTKKTLFRKVISYKPGGQHVPGLKTLVDCYGFCLLKQQPT